MAPAGRSTLLVLGGTGFLGIHVVESGSERFGSAIAAGRSAGPDLAVPGALRRLLDEVAPAAVLCCAAAAGIDECERDPERASLLNAELPGEAARRCRERGARFVHVSTDLVFGAREPRAGRFRESDPAAPLHAYGRTKAEGETRVLASDPGALVVRLPLLYGDSRGRGRGTSDALLDAVRRGERPALFTDEWRTPLEVGDAARALVALALSGSSGLLHLPGPERLTRHELGCLILQGAGRERDRVAHLVCAARRADLGLEGVRAADVSLASDREEELRSLCLRSPREALLGDARAPGPPVR